MDLKKYRGEGGGFPRNNLKEKNKTPGNRFVIQKHLATSFHFDFRLEIVDKNDRVNVLHSWIIPKNIPLEPERKYLAIKIENKPLNFLDFDKKVVGGKFGEGEIDIWDKGHWGLMKGDIEKGFISFNLFGDIIKSRYAIQKLNSNKDQKKKNHWVIWRTTRY